MELVTPILLAALPTILSGAVVIGLIWYFFKHPDSKYKPYLGLVIQAVKVAEKAIPDDSPNKSLAKANRALQEFNKLYEENTGSTPSEAAISWFNRVKEVVLLEMEKKK